MQKLIHNRKTTDSKHWCILRKRLSNPRMFAKLELPEAWALRLDCGKNSTSEIEAQSLVVTVLSLLFWILSAIGLNHKISLMALPKLNSLTRSLTRSMASIQRPPASGKRSVKRPSPWWLALFTPSQSDRYVDSHITANRSQTVGSHCNAEYGRAVDGGPRLLVAWNRLNLANRLRKPENF